MRYVIFDVGRRYSIGMVHTRPSPSSAQASYPMPDGFNDLSAFSVQDGQLVEIPRPSMFHSFNDQTGEWVDIRTPDSEWVSVRSERDRRLQASDWTQLPDVPLATKDAWAAYRQALRDITEQPDPFNITWPAVPG
jgi:hypothetical protein